MLTWSCVGAGGGRQSIESPPRTSFPCVLVHKVLVRLGDDHGAALSLPELPLDGVGAVPLVVHFLDNVRWVLPEESWVCWRLPGSVGAYQVPRTCCGTRRSCLGEPNRVRCPWISLIKADIWSATRETKSCSRWETERKRKVKNVLSGCVSFPLNITDVHSSLVHTTEKICNGV